MASPADGKPTKKAALSKAAEKTGGFPLPVGTAPMEARSAAELPGGGPWQYEPKWDGFRCLAFKSGSDVDIRANPASRSGASSRKFSICCIGWGRRRSFSMASW